MFSIMQQAIVHKFSHHHKLALIYKQLSYFTVQTSVNRSTSMQTCVIYSSTMKTVVSFICVNIIDVPTKSDGFQKKDTIHT